MSRNRLSRKAFTLIEMLGVVLIILVVAALTLGIGSYVSERMKISRAKAELATLELAIQDFQLDNGYYPTTDIIRLSYLEYPIQSNSWLLCQQLTAGPKKYITFRPDQLVYDGINKVTYLVDPWKSPIVYYNPVGNVNYAALSENYILTPGTTYELAGQNFYTTGGKVNTASYDLFSYGSDKMTYVPGVPASSPWGLASSATDDITNWKR